MAVDSSGPDQVRIKKYANRRLYNTATSKYVTLENLCQMVKENIDFVVEDAKTREDITRSVLAQIIFEEESKSGQSLLPAEFLRKLIRFYGDSLQSLVPGYLELSMEQFARDQDRLRQSMTEAWGDMMPMRQFEEMSRQNAEMFRQAMRMFNPFAAGLAGNGGGDAPQTAGRAAGNGAGKDDAGEDTPEKDDRLDDLKLQLARMQAQIDDLAGKK